MAGVEHSHVHNHTTQKATFAQSQDESCSNKATKRFGEAHESAGEAPCCDQGWKVDACLHMFDYPVGGNIDDDVGYVKDDESNVKLVTSQVQIVNHAVNFGIADIASVNERKEPAALLETCSRLPGWGFTPYSKEPGDDVLVEFSSGNLGNIGRNVYMHLFAPKHFNMALLWLLRLEPEFLGGFGHGLPDISPGRN